MSLKNYEVKKYKLGEVCDIVSGVSFRAQDYVKSGIPVLKIQHMQEGKIHIEDKNLEYVDKNRPNTIFINKGDVIMAGSGNTTGKIARSQHPHEFALNQRIYKIIPKNENELNKDYLYFFLDNCYREVDELIIKGTQPNLNKSSLQELVIFLPSLKEQQKIAENLDILNELKNELTLREKQYRYYRNYLINKPGGAVREYLLGNVCEIISGTSFKESGYTKTGTPVLKVKDIQDGVVKTKNLFYCDSRNNLDKSLVRYGDIVIAGGGSKAGKVGINLTNLEFLHTTEVLKLSCKESFINQKYMYHYLSGSKRSIDLLLKGEIIHHLYPKILSKLKLLLPSLEVQQNITSKLDAFVGNNSGIISLLQNQAEQAQKAYEWCRESLIFH